MQRTERTEHRPTDRRPTEREVLLTGIGGQGVQLAARTLAVAAVRCDLEAMMFGTYGGSMRGGSTAATVVLGQHQLHTPPDVDEAWGAMVLHHDHWPAVRDRLRPDGVVVVDADVFRGDVDVAGPIVVRLEATRVATEHGAARAASMVVLGAFAAATRIVTLESLAAAAHEVLPDYRAQHAGTNAEAIEAGWALVDGVVAPAWAPAAAEAVAHG